MDFWNISNNVLFVPFLLYATGLVEEKYINTYLDCYDNWDYVEIP